MSDLTDLNSALPTKIVGADTNGLEQGFVGSVSDRLKVENLHTYFNRTDVSTTVTASGNTSAIETDGMGCLNALINVTAISGASATFQLELQTSDDGTNFAASEDTSRFTATGMERFVALRVASRYYRYAWFVTGTTPSITFSVISTLKSYLSSTHSTFFRYGDLNLAVDGATSSVFSSKNASNISVQYNRGADGGNGATIRIQASNDGVLFDDVSANLNINPSQFSTITFTGQAFRFYRAIVESNTNAGTRVLDLFWSSN